MNDNEKNKLIANFQEEIRTYTPDWQKIIYAQSNENLLTDIFRERVKKIRKTRGMTQQDMAERIGCSKQCISKIEKKIKTIPIKKLREISYIFKVSEAYMLGLIEDEEYWPNNQEIYFWENPNSVYNSIKSYVIEKPLIYPLQIFGQRKEDVEMQVFEELKKHNRLLHLINDILHIESKKREKLIDVMLFLMKIL